MGHLGQIGGADEAVDVLAHGDGQPRFGLVELFRLDAVAQVDGLAAVVRHLDADRVFASHAFDENALGAHRQAEIVGEASDARVLHASLGLELIRCHHGSGIDLNHLARDVELGAFFHQNPRLFAQLILADSLRTVAGVEQSAGRQLEAAHMLRREGGSVRLGIGALVNGDFIAERGLYGWLKRRADCCRLEPGGGRTRIRSERPNGLVRSRCGLRGDPILHDRSCHDRNRGLYRFMLSWRGLCHGAVPNTAPACGSGVRVFRTRHRDPALKGRDVFRVSLGRALAAEETGKEAGARSGRRLGIRIHHGARKWLARLVRPALQFADRLAFGHLLFLEFRAVLAPVTPAVMQAENVEPAGLDGFGDG